MASDGDGSGGGLSRVQAVSMASNSVVRLALPNRGVAWLAWLADKTPDSDLPPTPAG
jgi:hypothetical protein